MNSMNGLAIDLSDVAKRYRGKIDALAGIAMRVAPGEIFGLLGPNGAGKSTLVKIIMTIVRPTRAAGTVLGRPIGYKPALARIGYLPENHRFPRYLSGRQVIEFFGALSRVDRPTRKRRAAELLDLVGMSADADRCVATYSKGMSQRIGLAQAMVNDPDLILLDEPTDGVDPLGRRDIRDVLVHLRSRGKTVFINSHMLSELEMICDRVAILVKGRVATQGSVTELSAKQQRYEIEVTTTLSPPPMLATVLRANVFPVTQAPRVLSAFMPPLPPRTYFKGKLMDGTWVEIEGPVIRLGHSSPAQVQPILDTLRQAGLMLVRVELVRPTLEELFMDAMVARGAVA